MNRFFYRTLALTGILFGTTFSSVFAQQKILPMDIEPYLSGSFGELRNNHFHSGIDFKTQGRIGIPVKSVKDGYLARVFVGPSGFGRALYVNHPDGTTTVYGHLDRFDGVIESAVRDSQYIKESFRVDLYFGTNQFPVKQGQIIGYSGNTGSSGGPHLHFEIRETSSEKVTDPLVYYKNQIKDTRPPEIRELMFFPQAGKGIVNGKTINQSARLVKDKTGKQVLSQPIKAWGNIGIGIKAYDRMNGTDNIYGVREIILKIEGTEVFHSCIDRFSFDESRYINSFIDWTDWVKNRSFFMKSYVEPGNRLDFYQTPYDGTLNVNQEKNYQLEYTLSDAYGNQTVFYFEITGHKQEIPLYQPEGTLFVYNRDNELSDKGIQLKIPQGNLYKDHYLSIWTTPAYSSYSPLYTFNERIPLHTPGPLSIKIANDTYSDKSKYGIVSVNDKGQSWLGGRYEDGKIHAGTRETGSFTVEVDTVPPVLTPIKPAQWAKTGRIDFKLTDNLSGISQWKATLDGKFVLFELDAKRSALFGVFDSRRMKHGKQTLRVVVSDASGNQSVYENEIVF